MLAPVYFLQHADTVEIRGPDRRGWRTACTLAVLSCAACIGTESGNPSAREAGMSNNVDAPGLPIGAGASGSFGNPVVPTNTPPTTMPPASAPTGAAGGGSGGTGGGATAGMGSAGTAPSDPQVPTEPELCPDAGPRGDPLAPKEPCCYRTSNAERSAELGADESEQLEYRVVWSRVTNHDASLGSPAYQQQHELRQRREHESMLLRLTLPRRAGERVSGVGMLRFGYGASLCDGTYAFFGPSSPYAAYDMFTRVQRDAAATRVSVDPAVGARLPLRAVPVVDGAGAPVGVEIAYQGLLLSELELVDPECIGEKRGDGWLAGTRYATFLPLAPNDAAPLPEGHTACAAVAFGEGTALARCADAGARCVPGSAGCVFRKLPDSLCPENEIERALYGCHVGWADNPDGEPADCTMPPAAGSGAAAAASGVSGGQGSLAPCCDPLGEDPALPACNAWLVRGELVAAAVEIDAAPAPSVLVCQP